MFWFLIKCLCVSAVISTLHIVHIYCTAESHPEHRFLKITLTLQLHSSQGFKIQYTDVYCKWTGDITTKFGCNCNLQ